MGLFDRKKKVGFIADVIRCDEKDYLIWKWHPENKEEGQHTREYAIRCGSKLRVKEGEVAVFFYKQQSGASQDFIIGPYDDTLKTKNFPVLTSIATTFFGGDTPWQAEVFFINVAGIVQVDFRVPYFDIFDYRYSNFGVPVAVGGKLTFSIADYKDFIKLHSLRTFSLEDFKKEISSAVVRSVKTAVGKASRENKLPVLQIESSTEEICAVLEENLRYKLSADFGIKLVRLDINQIDVDKSSEEYQDLLAVSKNIEGRKIEATADYDIEHYGETLRIQREEGQYAKHMDTRTQNIGAYQIEKQVEVGVAGAEALGQMGANGAGSVNLGNGGAGFNPASMMASIAVGSVVGRQVANTMESSMGGINNPTPPPVPQTTYFVAVDGKQTGPYDMATLQQMIASGNLVKDSYVWKQGMASWEFAKNVDEIAKFFPPEIPK